MKKKVQLYTLKGLAEKLGLSYVYIRSILVRVRKGEMEDFQGYKFFGESNKSWYAYDAKEYSVEVVDAEGLPE